MASGSRVRWPTQPCTASRSRISATASNISATRTQDTVPARPGSCQPGLARYDELVPAIGVYVTWLRVGDECFEAVTNVGNRPTFGADSFAIESHLLNFHPIELLPETELELIFLQRLRPEVKFPSVEALREQIARDVHKARRYFRLLKVIAK